LFYRYQLTLKQQMKDQKMKKLFNVFLLTLTIAARTVGLSACSNTWDGAGRDVENIGEEMQN
jgi:predicted small secreted protein